MWRADKNYRKKSLLIHPDKLKHERGIEAFDLLKKVLPSCSLARPAADLPLSHPPLSPSPTTLISSTVPSLRNA